MDDLSGLSWTPSSQDQKKPPPMNSSSAFATLRPTPPISGRSTPLNGPVMGSSNPPSKPATPSNDSFSNLVSFNAGPSSKSLSLQEQQKRLQEQRAQQEAARRKQLDSQYGGDGQFWDALGSGRNTPAMTALSQSSGAPSKLGPVYQSGQVQAPTIQQADSVEEEDLLAAFKSTAPVDSSTNFPKPATPGSTIHDRASRRSLATAVEAHTNGGSNVGQSLDLADDDDPFGLSQMQAKAKSQQQKSVNSRDEDDVLGMLSRPVDEFRKAEPKAASASASSSDDEDLPAAPQNPRDRAVAEIVEMGFPAEKAQQALATTESGTDIQAAIGWLLNTAHSESRQKTRTRDASHEPSQSRRSEPRGKASTSEESSGPAWMRNSRREDSGVQPTDTRSPDRSEKDPAQIAAELSSNFLKTAGSLWKTGTKKMQQAVQEFSSEHDSSQPRWMREPASEAQPRLSKARFSEDGGPLPDRRRSQPAVQPAENVTDEAMMLESDRARPAPRKPQRPKEDVRRTESLGDHPPPSALRDQKAHQPAFLRQQQAPRADVKSSLSRQAIEDQASQAYVSSARRRRPPPKPAATESEPDLLGNAATIPAAARPASTVPSQPSRPSKPSTPMIVRPKAPARSIPPISPIALKSSHQHRDQGTEHFKRGDYSAAHASYSTSLSQLPPSHPITIVLLTNHALTSLKTGEPKQAITDADAAIALIGPSRGDAEVIDLQNGETPKPMRDFFGKALMRKAEALEQMERWTDAAAVWREAVESGHGGSTSIEGRNRCEKAGGIKQPSLATSRRPTPAPRKSAPVVKRPSAMADLQTSNAASSAEAVTRLRAANAAAERADDEKFALADSVDTKLTAWKGGKADNLRALLGSLDTVLWPEAGWKKVGMAELVLPNKVKVVYMKGIAKVHPDKVRLSPTFPSAAARATC